MRSVIYLYLIILSFHLLSNYCPLILIPFPTALDDTDEEREKVTITSSFLILFSIGGSVVYYYTLAIVRSYALTLCWHCQWKLLLIWMAASSVLILSAAKTVALDSGVLVLGMCTGNYEPLGWQRSSCQHWLWNRPMR